MTASTWRSQPAPAAMEKGRIAYIAVPQDVVLGGARRTRNVGDSGRVLSALLVLLGVVCCLAWMGGLIQLPFNSPTPERWGFLRLKNAMVSCSKQSKERFDSPRILKPRVSSGYDLWS